MAVNTNEMLEFSKDFQAGYFYTFGYNALNKKGTDGNPVIYCAYAEPTSNLISGINFHYFNDKIKLLILTNMHSKQYICSDDKPHIFNGGQLYQLYSNIAFGLRDYNKTRMSGIYRIHNKHIADFMHLPSDFFMTNDNEQNIMNDLTNRKNKGF